MLPGRVAVYYRFFVFVGIWGLFPRQNISWDANDLPSVGGYFAGFWAVVFAMLSWFGCSG